MGEHFIQIHPQPRQRTRRRRNVIITLDDLMRTHQRSLRLRRRVQRDIIDESLGIFVDN